MMPVSKFSKPPIFLLSGTPASGKSSVARALLERFPFGYYLPVDDLREFVVAGIAHPVPVWTDETTRQFKLARQAAAHLATFYNEADFAVVIDDVLHERDAQEISDWLTELSAQAENKAPIYKILLRPSLEVTLERNRWRSGVSKTFDTSVLAEPIRAIYQSLGEQNRPEDGWLIVDSSALTLAETVDFILEHT